MGSKVRPNVVSGGSAIDLGNGLFYMKGRTHKQGGIDIGSNPRTGIEVENGEIYDAKKGRVYSAQPILNGISPANALLMGGNPNNIFNAQEAWKQANHYNDDGTKFEGGGYTPSKEIIDYIKKTEGFRDKWYKDGNGIDTIGYGFTGSRIKKLYPNGITREQADKEFADSIAKRALILAKDTPNWNKLSQSQRDALLSYHYNVGEGSYRNKHPKLQQALANSDWENVMLNMDAGYNDKKNPGLRVRRDYERQLFKSGIDASLTGEKQFRDWYDRYSRSHNLNPNPDAKEHFYDYRNYYKNRTKEQANEEWKLDSHLPDTYKKPGHPTFSTESIYSTRRTPGGTWKKVGLGPVYDEQFFDSKYTKNLRKYQNVSFKYGGIHIKPSKRGTFTAAAKRHHMSVQEFARTVLNNRARYSAAMVKKANFARNASKWHKKELGGDMTKQYYITRDNIYSLGGNVRRKAFLGAEEYERFIDADGKMKYRIGNSVYSKDGFSRATGMSLDEIDSYFDAIDNEGRGEVSPSILRNYRTVGYNRALQRTVPFIDSLNGITYLGEQKPEIEPSIITGERKSTVAQSSTNTSTNTNSKQSKAKSFKSETNVEPSIVKAYRTPKQGVRQNTIGFDSSLAGVSYYGPNRDSELPEQQTYTPQTRGTRLQINTSGRPTTDVLGITPLRPYNGQQIDSTNRTRLPVDTSGRPTARAIGFAQLRPYDGRPIETPTSGTQSSSTGGQRRNSNRPTTSSAPTAPVIPVDYNAIDTQINNENNRILAQSLNNDILTPITGRQLSPIVSASHQGLAGGTSVRTVPNNPYYSRLNVGLHKIGNYIKNNPDLIGLGVNLTGNLAASLINRSAIKGMKYAPAPIPISAQKLPTEVNIEPQVSSIKENVAGQERLIADNTADSRVALARRQRVRNQGVQQYQTLFGNKLNTELQLLTADRLNLQGVDTQNVTQYNRWRGGLYDFENRRREMFAENAVAGINNAAEAIAGERGYLARREARKRDLLNMGLIAATSPNAQNVIGSKEFEEFLRKIGYDGNFSLLRKRINV